MGNFITFDEKQDVAGSIQHIIHCADLIEKEPKVYKWIVLALHSALQGACICHLVTTASPLGVVSNKNAKEWVAYFNRSQKDIEMKVPGTFILALPELLDKVRLENSAGCGHSEKIEITDNEVEWLKRIHKELRNQFVHFEPVGWSIEVSGIPDIAELVAKIIKQIDDCGWAFRFMDAATHRKMRENLRLLREDKGLLAPPDFLSD